MIALAINNTNKNVGNKTSIAIICDDLDGGMLLICDIVLSFKNPDRFTAEQPGHVTHSRGGGQTSERLSEVRLVQITVKFPRFGFPESVCIFSMRSSQSWRALLKCAR
jgi:hypothetical protein